jgi:hypothetical protein
LRRHLLQQGGSAGGRGLQAASGARVLATIDSEDASEGSSAASLLGAGNHMPITSNYMGITRQSHGDHTAITWQSHDNHVTIT